MRSFIYSLYKLDLIYHYGLYMFMIVNTFFYISRCTVKNINDE